MTFSTVALLLVRIVLGLDLLEDRVISAYCRVHAFVCCVCIFYVRRVLVRVGACRCVLVRVGACWCVHVQVVKIRRFLHGV